MFAVFKTGGKQYRVEADDEIVVEKLEGEPGQAIVFDEVLMIKDDAGLEVGAPQIDGARVEAEVVEQTRAEKVYTFHKRRRKHSSKRLRGHRQHVTTVKITAFSRSQA